MPKISPVARMPLAELSAPSAALAPDRSIGIWPEPRKKCFWNHPLMPGVVKYSAFATKLTRRDSVSGMNSQSAYDRWLLARITGPSSGTFSTPEA